MWIVTWEGLSKYDGYRFNNYTKANGLVSNLVNDIYELRDGRMVIALNDSTCQLLQNEKVVPGEILKGITVNRFLTAGKAGLLMFTDQKGVVPCKDPQLQPASYDIKATHSLFVPLQDSLLLTVQVEGNFLELYNNRLEKKLKVFINSGLTYQLYKDSQGRIWTCLSNGLKQVTIDAQNQRVKLVEPPVPFNNSNVNKEEVRCMLEDVNGNYWIGTRTGLVLVEKDGSSQKFTTADGLPGDHIYCLFQDREKNIWIGTAQGLARIANQGTIQLLNNQKGILSDYVTSIKPAENDYLVGTGVGIVRIISKSAKVIPLDPYRLRLYAVHRNKSSLFSYTSGGYFGSIDLQNNRIQDSFKYELPANMYENCHALSDDGTFIIGTATGELLILRNGKIHVQKTPADFISYLLVEDDQLWIGSHSSGLYRASIDVKRKTYATNFTRFAAMPDPRIRSIFRDSKNNLWVGTRFNGVYKITEQKDGSCRVDQFDQRRGLLSDWVKTISEDKNNDIWIGSSLGVDKLIKNENGWRIFNYSRFNNLFGVVNVLEPCNDNSILVGMNNGIAKAPDTRYDAMKPLPVYITRIHARVRRDSSFLAEKSISLPYANNAISFDFSSPAYINEKEMRYSYRLIGSSDTSWVHATPQQSVSYASLQPGHYRFEVRNLGWNGKWGPTTAYSFRVKPPFWKTAWFITLMIIVLASLLYLVYQYRIRQLKRLQDVRNRIARDLHDDIGSALTNISMLTELSKRNIETPAISDSYLDRIREEIDASGQALDDIIWSVNSRNDSLQETAARMRRYAAELFDAYNIRYELDLDPLVAEKKIMMEQRKDLFLIYKEALNNIQKHAEATSVDIKLSMEKDWIHLKIEDNGKGFETTRATHRNGIMNIRERVVRWQGNLEIESVRGKGTRLEIAMRLNSTHSNRG
jgi:signal transduction histidine kinase/ligand-binding sensor domain-containing protein